MGIKAIFLDRDGTINHDPGYLRDPDDVFLIEGAGAGLRLLKDAGFLLLVVSNQSGIARGLISEPEVISVNGRINYLLKKYNHVAIDHFFYCPHHEDFSDPADCGCRKPATGMFSEAIKMFDIDVPSSWMIGDSTVDIKAAVNFGLRSILVGTGNGREHFSVLQEQNKLPNFTCSNLYDSAKLILKLNSGVSVC